MNEPLFDPLVTPRTLRVVAVEPYSAGDECATVILDSGLARLAVFAWGIDCQVGDDIPNRLDVVEVKLQSATLPDWPADVKQHAMTERLEQLPDLGYYACQGCARVIDAAHGWIQALGFVFTCAEVPAVEAVEFVFARVDLPR